MICKYMCRRIRWNNVTLDFVIVSIVPVTGICPFEYCFRAEPDKQREIIELFLFILFYIYSCVAYTQSLRYSIAFFDSQPQRLRAMEIFLLNYHKI